MSAAIDEARKLGMKATGDLMNWLFAPELAIRMNIDALDHAVPTGFKTGAPGRYSYTAEESRLLRYDPADDFAAHGAYLDNCAP